MKPIISIRPEPGNSASIEAGKKLGLKIAGHPMWRVQPREWELPDPAKVDALLIGSANALRHGGDQLGALTDKPVYAVGERTAEIARQLGFDIASAGQGGLQQVLDAMPERPLRLLRLAGAEHLPIRHKRQIAVDKRIVYETVRLPMDAALADRLRQGALVLLYSAAAARYLAEECDRLGLDRAKITLAALGPRIAAAAGDGWAGLECAPQPSEAALLALAGELS